MKKTNEAKFFPIVKQPKPKPWIEKINHKISSLYYGR